MKKLSILVLLIIGGIFINGCGTVLNNTDSSSGGSTSFTSVTGIMQECAPNLGSSSFSSWAAWTPTSDYGIFKKHFGSASNESIYSGAIMLDVFTQALEIAAENADSNGNFDENVTVTYNGSPMTVHATGNISNFTGTVTLPAILDSETIDGLTTKASFATISTDGTTILESITLYYGIVSNVQTLIHLQDNNAADDKTLGYSKINLTNGEVIYKSAFTAKDSIASDSSKHRALLFFEGNTNDKTSKFSIKTTASNGWAVFGGGSVADNNSLYAVRAKDNADGSTNDGANLTPFAGHYVIIANEDIYSGIYTTAPKNANDDLGGEIQDVANYIRTGADISLGWTTAYPDSTDIPATLTES